MQGERPVTEADFVVCDSFRHFEREMKGFLAVRRPDIDVNRAVGVVGLRLRQRHQDRPHYPLGAQSAMRYHSSPYMQLVIDSCGRFR